MASHYEILGVPASATAADVRKAYARIARDRHPYSPHVAEVGLLPLYPDAAPVHRV